MNDGLRILLTIFTTLAFLIVFVMVMENVIVVTDCDYWYDNGFYTDVHLSLTNPVCLVTNSYGVTLNSKSIDDQNDLSYFKNRLR